MLNDVHFPPPSRNSASPTKAHEGATRDLNALHGGVEPNAHRVLERLPHAARADVPEAIYGEPEDRGDSFNTLMSASIIIVVALVVGGVSWVVFL